MLITKKIRIGNCEFNERITFKELLLKMKNQEIDYFTVTKLLADKDYYKQYVDDILTICQSCGISAICNDTPGKEYYCIEENKNTMNKLDKEIYEHVLETKKMFEEGPINVESGIKLNDILMEFWKGKLDFASVYWILYDPELGGSLIDDLGKICQSCGVLPNIIEKDTGDSEFEMWLTQDFCEQTEKHQEIFKELITNAITKDKIYFSHQIPDKYTILAEDGVDPKIVTLKYSNRFDFMDDLLGAASFITMMLNPESFLQNPPPKIDTVNQDKKSGIKTSEIGLDDKVGRKKNNLKYGKYPFIIYASITSGKDTFPTHTRGLNNKNWPEFIINASCYGSDGNGRTINAAYDYFKRPRRKKLLNKILKGETVEIPVNKLNKNYDWKTLKYPVCFRLVPNTFGAVKMAYGDQKGEVDPDLVVVQIYVKGDDFALADDYYKHSIAW